MGKGGIITSPTMAPGQAKEIQVNRPQPEDANKPQDGHAICPAGDEDWLFFGGISGKVYTIDVPTMAAGLDLTLTLYDEAGHQLAFADDYYNRSPGTPDPARPRRPRPQRHSPAHPVVAPRWPMAATTSACATRLAAAAATAPTPSSSSPKATAPPPTQIDQLCQDIFEPDGLPEQAHQINPNEVQLTHILCPLATPIG